MSFQLGMPKGLKKLFKRQILNITLKGQMLNITINGQMLNVTINGQNLMLNTTIRGQNAGSHHKQGSAKPMNFSHYRNRERPQVAGQMRNTTCGFMQIYKKLYLLQETPSYLTYLSLVVSSTIIYWVSSLAI